MLSFSEGQELINRELQKLPVAHEPRDLYDPIKYIIKIGGKRLRPVLVLMSCNLFTEDYLIALKQALGIELFHNFTLLHDDIMDESEIRRNHPTVHQKWNKNIAILSGDAMSIMSHRFIADCDEGVMRPVIEMFSKTALEVCEGQQFDMNYENRKQISTQDYLKMIELKTAVLIAASMGIGALTGKASASLVKQSYEFGKKIGMAFQIRDDYLDVYGEPGVFGKMIGQDILSNKKTYLLTRSIELARGIIRKELQKWQTATDYDTDEKINAIRNIYSRLEIEKLTASAMNEYYQEAIRHLDKMKIKEDRKSELRKIADTILARHQ